VTVHPGGTGICPADDVITTAHGVLHDDTVGNVDCNKLLHDNIPSNDCGRVANAGYRDNLNCFTTLRAGKGENIQFTFTQVGAPTMIIYCMTGAGRQVAPVDCRARFADEFGGPRAEAWLHAVHGSTRM
jgi:hypothetical protein